MAIPDGAIQIEVRTQSIDSISQQTIAQSTPFVANLQAKTVQAEEVTGLFDDSNGDDQWSNNENDLGGKRWLVDSDGSPLDLSNVVDADGHADDDVLNSAFWCKPVRLGLTFSTLDLLA